MSEEMKVLREKLLSANKNGYDRISDSDLTAMEAYCAAYKTYLDRGKTERECAVLENTAPDSAAFEELAAREMRKMIEKAKSGGYCHE